jgi:hypothetical protein
MRGQTKHSKWTRGVIPSDSPSSSTRLRLVGSILQDGDDLVDTSLRSRAMAKKAVPDRAIAVN